MTEQTRAHLLVTVPVLLLCTAGLVHGRGWDAGLTTVWAIAATMLGALVLIEISVAILSPAGARVLPRPVPFGLRLAIAAAFHVTAFLRDRRGVSYSVLWFTGGMAIMIFLVTILPSYLRARRPPPL